MPENNANESQEELRSLIRTGKVAPRDVLAELLENLDELVESREAEDYETEQLRREIVLIEIAVESLDCHQRQVEMQDAWWAEQMAKRGEANG